MIFSSEEKVSTVLGDFSHILFNLLLSSSLQRVRERECNGRKLLIFHYIRFLHLIPVHFLLLTKSTEIENDLQDYLQKKKVPDLIKEVVRSLLLERPENPSAFFLQFFQKKCDEQAANR